MLGVSLKLEKELKGERLDTALTKLLPKKHPEHFSGATRSQIAKLIVDGGVKLREKTLAKSYSVKGGERIEISLGIWEKLSTPRRQLDFSLYEIKFDFTVLYEDEWLLVVSKPAGVLVHPTIRTKEATLIDLLKLKALSLANVDDPLKPGVVHRLDRGTSGVLVIAKDRESHFLLQREFAQRRVKKLYLALCIGGEVPGSGFIKAKLSRKPTRRELFRIAPEGREALTFYTEVSSNPLIKLLCVRILTGRTHQIRVHLSNRGLFILKDMDYGAQINRELRFFLEGAEDKSYRQAWSETLPLKKRRRLLSLIDECPGFFLHSYKIGFTHPRLGETVSIISEPPSYFMDVVSLLELYLDEDAILRTEEAFLE